MKMHWKEHLRYLESSKKWDEAIEFMQEIIKNNPNDMDAYIFMNYLLMNLLVEEDYDVSNEAHYITLTKWYFDESYAKFSNNAEYLYITGRIAVMSEWFFGIDVKDYDQMMEKAKQLDPHNLVYKENDYWDIANKDPKSPELIAYAKIVLKNNSPIERQLKTKGAVGEYLLEIKKHWAKCVLQNAGEIIK